MSDQDAHSLRSNWWQVALALCAGVLAMLGAASLVTSPAYVMATVEPVVVVGGSIVGLVGIGMFLAHIVNLAVDI